MQDIEKTYQKFLKGECSRQEVIQLLDYFRTRAGDSEMVSLLEAELDRKITPEELLQTAAFSSKEGLQQLLKQIRHDERPGNSFFKFWYAAALLLVIFGIFFYISGKKKQGAEGAYPLITDVAPGGNKATLTLASGRKINLNNGRDGIVVADNEIKYSNGANILDMGRQASDGGIPKPELLMLTTPKGGQYQVLLPDGTKVWLNAASTLKYPAGFIGNKREVELEGEAYFAVNNNHQASERHKQKSIPFIVKVKNQEIKVLGTEFNVTAYRGEGFAKTTLVKGAVKVSTDAGKPGQSTLLHMGEETVMMAGVLSSQKADISAATSWKSGVFYFKRTLFSDMMRQIARWYDIEVVYKREIPQESFSGSMDRNVSLLTILKILDDSGIVFKLEGRKLIIE